MCQLLAPYLDTNYQVAISIQFNTIPMNASMYFVLVIVALTAQISGVRACSCFPTTLEGSFAESNVFVRAKVIFTIPQKEKNYYLLKVERTYKGCNVPSEIWVSATKNCAACCIFLTVGQSYVFPFSSNSSLHQINSCQVSLSNPLWSP